MNEQQLSSTLHKLKRRTQDILTLLDNIIQRRQYSWPEKLEQYAVLSTHYFRLCDELHEALYHFVLFPEQLPQDVTWIPELLRTKLLPEQEKDMLALLDAFHAVEAGASDDDELLALRVANHNAALTEATKQYERVMDQSVRKGRNKLPPVPVPNMAAINQCCATLLMGSGACNVNEAVRQRSLLHFSAASLSLARPDSN